MAAVGNGTSGHMTIQQRLVTRCLAPCTPVVHTNFELQPGAESVKVALNVKLDLGLKKKKKSRCWMSCSAIAWCVWMEDGITGQSTFGIREVKGAVNWTHWRVFDPRSRKCVVCSCQSSSLMYYTDIAGLSWPLIFNLHMLVPLHWRRLLCYHLSFMN